MDTEEILPAINDDILDPSNLDKILIKLDEIMIEDDEFMQVLVAKVEPRIIYWEQPWYQQTGSLSRPIKEKKGPEEYREDKISSEEEKIIEKNWKKFIKKYDLPDKIICLARWRSTARNHTSHEDKARHFAVSYLSRGLQRSLYQVFRFLHRHYAAPIKLQRFSKYEENILKILYYHKPQNSIVIASKILKREPRGIAKKLNEIVKGKDTLPRLKWDLEFITKFVQSLMQHSNSKTLEEMKYKSFEKDVWLKVGEEMGQQYSRLQRYWSMNLHVQLFVKKPVYLNKIRKKVFKILQKTSYKMWSDIRWKEVLKSFPDGFTDSFLYKVSHSTFRRKSDVLHTPLPQLIEYALNHVHELDTTKCLRNLTMNDESEIVAVKYD